VALGRSRRVGAWDGTERRAPAKVLLVNDDADAGEMLARFLDAAGYRVASAPSAAAAMDRMQSELPRVVVLDISAGGVGSNLKLLDQIRTHDDQRIADARVILCAASPKNRPFSLQSGADSVVVRPFHLDDLLAQLADVLARANHERARHRRTQLAADGL
jgi:DNA-binding response OmpR family regulator